MSLLFQEDVTLAGGFLLGEDFVGIYVRPETGDVLYEDEMGSNVMMIDGISITEPMTLPHTDAIELAVRSNGFGPNVIGIIYATKYAVVITSETTAEIRPFTALTTPTTPMSIDIDIEDMVSED